MIGVCKFCGCTDDRPCLITEVLDEESRTYILAGEIQLIPADCKTRLVPCAWVWQDVCSAPACVGKAYAEAWPLADQILNRAQMRAFDELHSLALDASSEGWI